MARARTNGKMTERQRWGEPLARTSAFVLRFVATRSWSLLRCYGAPGRIRTADASLRTAALYPLSYGGAQAHRTSASAAGWQIPAIAQGIETAPVR